MKKEYTFFFRLRWRDMTVLFSDFGAGGGGSFMLFYTAIKSSYQSLQQPIAETVS
jgi:hypothetical protein